MKNLNTKKAFTLVELLTVVVIIGMIASVALVTLRDTSEVKAKQYTKKVIERIKDGIVYEYKDKDYIEGFLNDFGIIPPNTHFLINEENNNHFMSQPSTVEKENKLQKYKINDLFKVEKDTPLNDIPMPFIEIDPSKEDTFDHDGDTTTPNKTFYTDSNLRVDLHTAGDDGLEKNLETDLYQNKKTIVSLITGYLGGYLNVGIDSNKESTILDGWNNVIELENDTNITEYSPNIPPLPDDLVNLPYLNIISFGSDTHKDNMVTNLKNEFNETLDDTQTKALFKDDLEGKYEREYFVPKNIKIDLNIPSEIIIIDDKGTPDPSDDDIFNMTDIKLIIYSPMLYYVENISGIDCVPYDNQRAECPKNSGILRKYIPYLPYVYDDYTLPPPNLPTNPNWYSGIIKYELEFDISNLDNSKLKINNDTYDFDKTVGTETQLKLTDFIAQLKINGANISEYNTTLEQEYPFYIPAGEKYIVILQKAQKEIPRGTVNDIKWKYVDSFTQVFMPNRTVTIKQP